MLITQLLLIKHDEKIQDNLIDIEQLSASVHRDVWKGINTTAAPNSCCRLLYNYKKKIIQFRKKTYPPTTGETIKLLTF